MFNSFNFKSVAQLNYFISVLGAVRQCVTMLNVVAPTFLQSLLQKMFPSKSEVNFKAAFTWAKFAAKIAGRNYN
jgi:hypothetical protein